MPCSHLSRKLLGVLLAGAVVACDAPAPSLEGSPEDRISGELLIGVDVAALEDKGLRARLEQYGTILDVEPKLGVVRLQLREGDSEGDISGALSGDPDVRFAEQNAMAYATATPNDPSFSSQYALTLTGTDKAWEEWQPTRQVVVAIIDTGVDLTHPDLVNKLLTSGGAVVGYDFVNTDANASDDQGHGTHCAGIAAGQVNNGAGIAGVAGWTGASGASDTNYVKIMPVKALGSNGSGSHLDIAEAITWAVDSGAHIISLSLGSSASTQTLADAVAYAWSKNVLVVAAAGNDSTSALHYPAAYDKVLAVASTDSTDTLSSFSNYGSWVNIAAPGSAIMSTLNGGGYGSMSGTSMACPFVAGAAALVWSEYGAMSALDLRTRLLTSVDSFSPYSGNTIASGAGRINVLTALGTGSSPPPSHTVSDVTLSATSVKGAKALVGTVRLSSAAPPGGTTVQLSSSSSSVTFAASSVKVLAGATSTSFKFSVKAVSANETATLTATLGSISKAASLSLLAPSVGTLRAKSAKFTGGVLPVLATVTLDSPAGPGGLTLNVSSSSADLSVPSTVTVPAGAKTISFPMTTNRVSTDTPVTVTATFGGVSKTAAVTVLPWLASVRLSSSTALGGAKGAGKVYLNAPAPEGGLTVALASSNGGALAVPASVNIPARSRSASFAYAALGQTAAASVTVTGTALGSSKSASMTVGVTKLSSFTLSSSLATNEKVIIGRVALLGAAPAGGVVLTVTSSHAAASVPATVTVPEGATSVTFEIDTLDVSTAAAASITLAYGGLTKTAKLRVLPVIASLKATGAGKVGGAARTGLVTLNEPAPEGGLVIALTSSSAGVSVPASVTVEAGKKTAAFDITADPTATDVSATLAATYGNSTATAAHLVKAVSVSAVKLDATSVSGGGSVTATVTLTGAAPAGGFTVTTRTSNTTTATVSSTMTVDAGAATGTFTVTAASVSANASVTIYANTRSARLYVTP